MFYSAIPDVIVGLISVFLAVTLIASAVTEGVSTVVSPRATTLLAGITKLLNTPISAG